MVVESDGLHRLIEYLVEARVCLRASNGWRRVPRLSEDLVEAAWTTWMASIL